MRVSFLIALMISVTSIVYYVRDYEKIKTKARKTKIYKFIMPVVTKLSKMGVIYIKTQFTIMCINALIYGFGLYAINNSYFLLLGIVIAAFDALPILGAGGLLLPIGYKVFGIIGFVLGPIGFVIGYQIYICIMSKLLIIDCKK